MLSPPIQKLSKITTAQSLKSLNMSRICPWRTPVAGLTPSGMNTGLYDPQGVITDKRSEVFCANLNW